MADDEERAKAEKLAAAKKRVAQLQKKKKGNKKAGGEGSADAPKEDKESPKGAPLEEATTEGKQDVTEQPEQTKPEEEEGVKIEEKSAENPQREASSPTEPMPETPTSLPSESDPQSAAATAASSFRLDAPRPSHGRQPSLSIQSKMRSSSFRKGSVSQGSLSPSPSTATAMRSPSLPPLSADGDSVQEVYRKQSGRIEELERENKRLEKELEEASGRWRKTEEQLEDLRESSVDVAELKEKLARAEEMVGGIDSLKEEIASLQRQNSHLQTRSHRNASVSAHGTADSPPSDLVQQVESKSATIEAMELEISNLRAQLSSQSISSNAHETQIKALEEKLSTSESSLEKAQREVADTKQALTRASEKAVKEGVDKTSTETLIKNLEREIDELKTEKSESANKTDTLEKKLQALGNLHRESESRHQARLRESEKTEKEAIALRTRLASIENENLRLKEERDSLNRRDNTAGSGGADDDALDELEDEGRSRLERRIRELEGENFDLRRGVWREKRQELEADQYGFTSSDDNPPPSATTTTNLAANAFDDVDLVGGSPDHTRRRSIVQPHQQQQHSSLSTVLSSGIAAFTGSNTAHHSDSQDQQGTRGSLELLSEENMDDEFDEEAFAHAQREEEAKKRVEWAREIKGKLKDWKGWRLDLVDSRVGVEGVGGAGMGEIFVV